MKNEVLFILFITILSMTGCSKEEQNKNQQQANDYECISAEEAKELMDTTKEDYVILDVRTKEEYCKEHIPRAILIPDYEITERANEELSDKEQLILVYCRSGNRSKTASEKLAEMGYSNVKEFGGINDWPYNVVK